MTRPRVVILGGGPAGLGAAYKLSQNGLADVSVIEKSEEVGGMAGSFNLAGIPVDYGSHRLHPSCDPEIIRDIKNLLGDELLELPRHGRIRLNGRWIRFPLKPLDLVFRLPLKFSFGVASDVVAKAVDRCPKAGEETFAAVLERGLGRTIFNQFYSPYAKKIWGVPPEQLSARQAYRRVSARSLQGMIKKVLPGLRGAGAGGKERFFYHPQHGFGQISQRFFEAAKRNGAEFFLGSKIESLTVDEDRVKAVSFVIGEKCVRLEPDYIWSTIPLSDLLGYIEPGVPSAIVQAANHLEYRAMIFIYWRLERTRFSEYDAHYFPETGIPLTRLSEPKNYNGDKEPGKMTVLCAELPCSVGDEVWRMTEDELADLARQGLRAAGIPMRRPVQKVIVKRIPRAYPIHRTDHQAHFDKIDRWLGQIRNLLSFGRHGLFAHDNVHHALSMSYAAVKCLDGVGSFDHARWREFRKTFDNFVVED
jgi:protoporphyrinogen oxidase